MRDTLPETMACIEIAEPGGPDVLRPGTRPVPQPGAGEVLVKVAAAGVNRPDIIQREGNYKPPPGITDVPGLEIAGSVAAPQCLPVPRGLDMVAAAALPETFFTVWTNVFGRAALQPGESLLIHGGSSGIGTAAIQMASRLGSRVIATAGSAEKCAACQALGAEGTVNYREEDFVKAAKEFGGGKGVDVVLDMVGGDYTAKNLAALAPDGRLVNIAFLKGSKMELNLLPMMLKRLTLTGSTLRPQTVERKGQIAAALKERVWPLIESGDIKPVIHATFPLAEAAEAHRLMESGIHIGKIVLVA
jgi:NADPH2:quinone reductase